MTYEYFKQRLVRLLFSGDNSLSFNKLQYLPRWLIILIDISFASISLVLTYLVIDQIFFFFYDTITIWWQAGIILALQTCFFFIFRTYAGVIRHSNFIDLLKLVLSTGSVVFCIAVFHFVFRWSSGLKVFLMPSLIIYSVFASSFMMLFRMVTRQVYLYLTSHNLLRNDVKKIMVYGVNDDTISLAELLSITPDSIYEVIGFITLKAHTRNIRVMGKPVVYINNSVSEAIRPFNVDGVLMVADKMDSKQRNEAVDKFLDAGLKVYASPIIQEWEGEADPLNKIQQIQIEDLLERDPIQMDDRNIVESLKGQTILVTGGAGSIGTELVTQIAKYGPEQIFILDQAETALHELELRLLADFPDLNVQIVLADVANRIRMEKLLGSHSFDLIFHAAAYKHVPLMEGAPYEAIHTNLIGTMNLAELAVENRVKRFVFISTDKAVNPTNVMGATKRAAELFILSLQGESSRGTDFITTRFGNVLGSNGSVIPRFKEQIAAGGPITVTHPDIIRYFMTIPEASQLVLQAATMGNGGEVFVFDMGEPVRIMDLAKKMIKLSGLEPQKDIEIIISGLRPGEKLYEELLADETTTLPTHHNKIMVSSDKVKDLADIKTYLLELRKGVNAKSETELVQSLKNIIPEYTSKNSRFAELDTVLGVDKV